MSLLRLIKRTTETAVKLPFAMAWDCMSLGNMGEGASTTKVLQEHKNRKYADEILDVVDFIKEIK